MNVSSALIVEKLTGQFLFNLTGQVSNAMNLSRPVFLTPGMVPQNSQILVAHFRRNDEIPKTKVNSVLFTQGKLLEQLEGKFDCILTFEEDSELFAAVNYIQSVFNLYDSWQQDLSDFDHQGNSLEELIDRSQQVFVNPILVHDQNFKFIAYSSFIDATPNLGFLVSDDSLPNILNDYALNKVYQDTFTHKDVQCFPASVTGIRTLYKNLFYNDKFMYRILIPETTRTLCPSDMQLLEIFSEYVRYNLFREKASPESQVMTLSALLQNLISNIPMDEYQLEKIFTNYNWINGMEYFCILLQVSYVDVQNRTTGAIVNFIAGKIKGCCVFEHDDNIVMYVNLAQSDKTYDEILGWVKPFIRDHNLKAGISRVHSNVRQLFQLLYRQAEIALDVGIRHSPYIWIHRYEDIYDMYLLERCTSELPASMVISPEILKLYRHDKEHNTDYYHTLKVYLSNNMQPVATSKELFIHRTTFLYRIDKMTELFGLKLYDHRKRLMYMLSIALIDQSTNGI